MKVIKSPSYSKRISEKRKQNKMLQVHENNASETFVRIGEGESELTVDVDTRLSAIFGSSKSGTYKKVTTEETYQVDADVPKPKEEDKKACNEESKDVKNVDKAPATTKEEKISECDEDTNEIKDVPYRSYAKGDMKHLSNKQHEVMFNMIAVQIQNEFDQKIMDLEGKINHFKEKVTSEELILLNAIDMDAFKKELGYYVLEASAKDKEFQNFIASTINATKSSSDTENVVKKGNNKSIVNILKHNKENFLWVGLLMVLMFIVYKVLFSSSQTTMTKESTSLPQSLTQEVKDSNNILKKEKNKTLPASQKVVDVNLSGAVMEDAIKLPKKPKPPALFLIKTKNNFRIDCENGYYKMLTEAHNLEGHLEGDRFWFKTELNHYIIDCYLSKSSIEIMY